MDTTAFNDLTENILNDPTTYQQLKKDPTNRLQREHKALLKELLEGNQIGPTLHKQLAVPHPRPPYARATIKVHKDPVKARLLVCSRNTVHYNTAQHLARLLAPLGKTANSFISDSADFCSKISTISQLGQFISYDVVDLFTNIPREEALDVIRSRLHNAHSTLDTHLTIDSIIRLINSCISSTYFTWSDRLFQQTHGLPMGSPLSPIITEIYMTHLEENALQTAPFQPLCWYRKVDDTFVIIDKTNDPKQLLDHLNSQHPRMKFTMEEEANNQLPFLDVLVQRQDNQLVTSVYRKPTHTDQYLHFTSNHPLQVKKGIISTLTRRAKNICSTTPALESELEHLRRVFITYNQYPPQLVNNIIASTLSPPEKQPRRESAPFIISLPYVRPVSHHIRRLLKQQANIDVVFQRGKSIQNVLHANGKPPTTTKQDPSGVVYHIPCECGDSYIGETSRPLQNRIKEHQSSVQKKDSKSAISDHIKTNPDHSILWNNIRIIEANRTDYKIRKLLEAINIKRHNPPMNRDQGYFIPSAYHHLINCNNK